jgi:hypothetical protein
MDLLIKAGANFTDPFAALHGARAIADALDNAKYEALQEAERTTIAPD